MVDNGSPDGCGKQLTDTDFGDKRVTVLPLPRNIGFGKGHNTVLDRWESDVHFILNPDILLTEDILEPMADWLLSVPGAAMATPQLRYPDGGCSICPGANHPLAAAGPPAGAQAGRRFPQGRRTLYHAG